ncbi:epididymal-specific lipocalin-6 isoform X3 [Mus musculus]|uniref:epididymal-specific lipocalin-6 isoform X3 n=1 Tax=Mus musculus TaxID=10090 RepID=UPI0003D731A5|nr:epididymal-specific lipocalin-6 isoform X3 [Mus musculus]|eukprot:XP_006498276.1 PREDICTED: epididymal-specific lipocalin-6 isoform X3 [Mus musculus]
MKVILLTAALLALVSIPWLQAVWLGRLDPKQLLGPWYVLAVASRAKDFMVEKDMKNVEGVVVTLTPDNKLRVESSRHGPGGCHQSTVELLKQESRWVFENPSLGILDYRVLGTNFKDYAVVFTQLEFGDEVFNTVSLYSRTEMASHEAMQLFTKWSQGLGFLSQQQAQLQKDLRPVWTVSSTEACGWDPGNCYSPILTTGSLLLQSLVHTRSSSECHTLDIAPQHPGILVEVGRHGLCTVAGGTGADWLLS